MWNELIATILLSLSGPSRKERLRQRLTVESGPTAARRRLETELRALVARRGLNATVPAVELVESLRQADAIGADVAGVLGGIWAAGEPATADSAALAGMADHLADMLRRL